MQAFGVGRSHQGRGRDTNEDALYMDDDLGLYMVSDGMGGHAAGEVAARMAVETVARYVSGQRTTLEQVARAEAEPRQLTVLLAAAVRAACREVYGLAISRSEYSGMGCSLTAILVAGNRAAMAHVGNTRLYLRRDGAVHQLSVDHTLAQSFANLRIEIMEKLKRGDYAHILTRTVGHQESVEVDTLLLDLAPDDRLLLCSNGFYDQLSNPALLSRQLGEADFESIPDTLIEFAVGEGASNNATVVVVRTEADEDDARRQTADMEMKRKLRALGAVFMFEDASYAQLVRVMNACSTENMDAGQTILAKGSLCDRLHIVVSGRVALADDVSRVEISPGGCFGESMLLQPRQCRATAESVEPSLLLILDRTAFLDLIRARPRLGNDILERLGRHLSRELDALCQSTRTNGSPKRTAATLL